MSQILFNRTVKTNIIIYPTNGTGRDGYIMYNNAGFWKDNLKRFSLKDKYKRSSFARFRSIRKIPPIWNYHSDGTGRDTYILYNDGGLMNIYKTPSFTNFRTNYEDLFYETSYNNKINNPLYMTKDEKLYMNKLTKIQKGVVDRLYYQSNKFHNLKRENSYGNVFTKLKLEPIIKKNRYYNDEEKNIINENNMNINERYFNNNNELTNRNSMSNIFNDMNKSSDKKSRNKLATFRKYRIKCLTNEPEPKVNQYPFNQINKNSNFIRKSVDKKYNLFN